MIVDFVKSMTRNLRQLILPGACLACHQPLPPERADFCAGCLGEFSVDPFETCPRCSSTVGPHANCDDGCPECRKESLAFERAVRLGPYDGLLRVLILRMKQPGGEVLAEAVADTWAQTLGPKLRELRPDVVVPIPLHWFRRWQRGFNQSEVLAGTVARMLGVPCRGGWLKRVRHTPKQTSLTPTQRRENVKGAFRVSRLSRWQRRTVLLIDDVLTTGSTAHEAAKVVQRAGAGRVVVAVLGHG
jgi:ComF family protein